MAKDRVTWKPSDEDEGKAGVLKNPISSEVNQPPTFSLHEIIKAKAQTFVREREGVILYRKNIP